MNPQLGKVQALFQRSIEVKQEIMNGPQLGHLLEMAHRISERMAKGGKLLICGNGGSAADAQHLAAELLVRLRSNLNRRGLPSIALAMDSSTQTACANDFGYDVLYERMVETLGQENDILLGITTSGRSTNVVRALQKAREMKLLTCGFLGGDGLPALNHCDLAFHVPSFETGRTQECHITAGHGLMELIEDLLLEKGVLTELPLPK